jgi:hypothetical protein
MPRLKNIQPQTIGFPKVVDLKANSAAVQLKAKAGSGLTVHYEVAYGPVAIEGDKLKVSEFPSHARYPLKCKVTAYQIGRRRGPLDQAAEPVPVTFKVVSAE